VYYYIPTEASTIINNNNQSKFYLPSSTYRSYQIRNNIVGIGVVEEQNVPDLLLHNHNHFQRSISAISEDNNSVASTCSNIARHKVFTPSSSTVPTNTEIQLQEAPPTTSSYHHVNNNNSSSVIYNNNKRCFISPTTNIRSNNSNSGGFPLLFKLAKSTDNHAIIITFTSNSRND
jgi:hypothetical protein